MKKYLSWKLIATLVVTLGLIVFDLPGSTQASLGLPESITKNKTHLGLDLQGGSQLDYKVDLRKVPAEDQSDIIDGVKEVIERRVNGLGVTEPNIYIADIGEEKHIIVELAETGVITQEDIDNYLGKEKTVAELTDDEKGLVSLEKAKAVVGKTILLEFKEEKGSIDPEEKEKITAQAQAALDRIKNGEDYSVVAQEEKQAYPGNVKYNTSEYLFSEEIPAGISEVLNTLEVGQYKGELVEITGEYVEDLETGQRIQETGLTIIKLVDKSEEIKNAKEVDVSHILISYTGADGADASVTRTKDEAYELAKEIKGKLSDDGDFTALAKEYSDDASNKDDGGVLSAPVIGNGTYVYDFEKAALAFTEKGQLTEEPIHTQFGYHLIKANEVRKDVKATKYKYETLTYSTVPDPWKDTGLTGKNFVRADVQLDNFYQPYITIQFDEEGATLFEEITGRNINKRVAIFVGGERISAPRVNEQISGGSAQITGEFTMEEARTLARDLNTGAIPAPIILTGEYTIGATLGHSALNQSLLAGAFGLIFVMIFMLLYYRLSGLVADAALIVYASILLFLFKSQLPLLLAVVISLIMLGFMVYKIMNNKDSGWEKFLSMVLSFIAFIFITFLLKTPVVVTLAGVAGLILSIGMAVDANILIFERFKEEIKDGKTFKAAVDAGFSRAWSSIRDSNFSTLLTCAILFYFGSSIIKGFAFTLAAGVVVSMFTALTITRILLQGFVGRKIAENVKAFGANPEQKERKIKFIENSKIWFTISGTLLIISIVSIFSFGLNLGIDFTGGTLLEFKFTEPVTKEVLADELKSIEEEINSGIGTNEAVPLEEESTETLPPEDNALSGPLATTTNTQELEATQPTALDLRNIQIIPSGENSYIIKTKYLTSKNHDQIIAKMKESFPEFTEPRFNTIGPTLGASLLSKAKWAMIVALLMIILYIAFAFRKVPKEVSPWKFGAAAIAALLHDVIIVTGLFIILSQFMNVEIDALFVTAMLTVFGYSVNDTIVVFDRLRENLIHSRDESLVNTANKSLNQTLTRSINTSFSTLITLVAILILGSSSIFYFILALTAGTIVGTYSSIFTASPLLVMWNKIQMKKE